MRRVASKADSNLSTRNTCTRLYRVYDDGRLCFVLVAMLAETVCLVEGQCDYGGGLLVVSILGGLSYHQHRQDRKKPFVKTPVLGL